MKKDIVIPPLGDSVTEATVGRILTPPGTQVKLDQELIEIETDKVNQVLYAPQAGAVSFSIKAGDTVKVGQIIGFVDSAAAGTAAPTPAVASAPAPVATAPQPAPPPTPAPVQSGGVRHMQDAFIKELSEKPAAPTPAPIAAAPAPASGSRETRRPMPRIRKVIAKRLVDVQNTTAMLTTFNEVDMSAIMKLREQYKDKFSEKHGTRLGFLSFFVKAAVKALQAIPDINSYIDGDDIVHRDYYDIAVAVGTDKGLVVPVLRGCDKLSFAGIEKGVADLAKKAKDGKLAIDDMQGGGFTITNGGVYGSLLSTPILNSPQSGILGMHNIVKRAVVVNDQIVIRPMMYLALSYDHRIVDGKEAVTFLVNMKDSLEDPSRLMLDL